MLINKGYSSTIDYPVFFPTVNTKKNNSIELKMEQISKVAVKVKQKVMHS